MNYKTYGNTIVEMYAMARTAINIVVTRAFLDAIPSVVCMSRVHCGVRCCRKRKEESEDRETHNCDCWNSGERAMLFLHVVCLALLIL